MNYIPKKRDFDVTILKDLITNIKNGNNEIENIFNKRAFDYPKPVDLLKILLNSVNRPDAVILDFFAGSGTTGQAVLELNQEDGGNRHFILCTNNENNICENVTYQRLKTIITGLRMDGSQYSDGIPSNLKYFKTEMIDRGDIDLEDKLLDASYPFIELENFEDINHQKSSIYVAECNEDIDKDKVELKFNALKSYVEKHNQKHPDNPLYFAFVRDKEIEDELGTISFKLYFSNEEWTEYLSTPVWKPISLLFS